MRVFDISCEAVQQNDGSFTLLVKATGLTLDQAQAIATGMEGPFRTVCLDVMTKGGTLDHATRNMLKDRIQ